MNEQPILEIEWRYDTPPALVYDAWITPTQLRRWVWGTIASDATADVDPRVGGGFNVSTLTRNGDRWRYIGRYTHVDPGNALAFDIRWDAPMGYEAPSERATVEFEADGAGTLMRFRHFGIPEGKPAQTHEVGWRDTFQQLELLLASERP